MDLENLTLKDFGKLMSVLDTTNGHSKIGKDMIGKHVIIRTFSAGVWFGMLSEKDKNEVILSDARRMWLWKAKESISLSAVALYGIDSDESKIAPPVEKIWLEAIEIIPTTEKSTKSIKEAKNAEAR